MASSFFNEMRERAHERAMDWRLEEGPRVKELSAKFLGAQKEELAFIPNFSFGMFSLVQSLKPRKKVMLYREDYPSLTYPFQLGGFDIHWLDSDDNYHLSMDEIEDRILEEKIEILALSHVQWLSGFTIDIERLGKFCLKYDVFFIVDATQSLGARPIHFGKIGCDALIASCYKWMNAGFGLGLMCIRKEALKEHPPVIAGFGSLRPKGGEWVYQPSIHSYEPGSLHMPGFLILEQAIKEKEKIGLQKILLHNRSLILRLLEGLQDLHIMVLGEEDVEYRTGIIGIKGNLDLMEKLDQKDIKVSLRNGYLRVAPHFYNNSEDIDALLNALDTLSVNSLKENN